MRVREHSKVTTSYHVGGSGIVGLEGRAMETQRRNPNAVVPEAGHPAPAPAGAPPRATARLLFVDNIRVFLTILVLLFHLMIIYTGTGSWYYKEGREDALSGILGAWFIVVTQAYFMGFFLLISAYFVPGSYDRKGAGRFLRDRLVRLGIPLALYSWVIRPLLVIADEVTRKGLRLSVWGYPGWYFSQNALLGDGPLWFVETLLIFSVAYVLWRVLSRPVPPQPPVETGFPGGGAIALFGLLIAAASFLLRLWHPIDWSFRPLNLQLPFFAQYIALFIAGLLAYRRNWFLGLSETAGRMGLGIGILLILLFPLLTLAGGGPEAFKGGWHWQALAYALWESFQCLSLCIGLVYIFRHYADHQRKLAATLARNAYTAYIIHGPLITAIALLAQGIALYPLLKWGLVALVAVPLCFGLSSLIRRLPYADRVL